MNEDPIAQAHIPCPECGSSDARTEYMSGSSHCFSCKHTTPAKAIKAKPACVQNSSMYQGEYRGLPARHISKETCEFFDYQVGQHHGKYIHIANHRDSKGNLKGQHIRDKDKNFWGVGAYQNVLYGMHKYPAGSAKMLVITEGQIDAMSIAQMNNCKWPVVSVPNGFGAAKAIKRNLKYIESFSKVIFCFDNEDDAEKAAIECASILTPGKAFLAHTPLKDANEMLVAGRSDELQKALWDAEPYKPDGIKGLFELDRSSFRKAEQHGISLPYPIFNSKLRGLKRGKLYVLTAHSGVGKSTLTKEIVHNLRVIHDENVGVIYLEESQKETIESLIAIDNEVHFEDLLEQPDILTEEQFNESFNKLQGGDTQETNKLWAYDHFGSLQSRNLLEKLRYMAIGNDCDYIILDHVSIAISGESSKEGERKDIDMLMTKIRSLIEETGKTIICVAHLVKPKNEEAADSPITMYNLRGSASLYQLADYVIALEEGSEDNIRKLKILKNRRRGDSGKGYCDTLQYNPKTGRLLSKPTNNNNGKEKSIKLDF